ncbi:hypothetical protein GGX14DRAFT_309926, partial [Mycena pura]
ENMYGMDESGLPPSNRGRKRVVGRRGTKTQYKTSSANWENVVTICADGTTLALKPTIIFNKFCQWFGCPCLGLEESRTLL